MDENNQDGYYGAKLAPDSNDEYNALLFMVRQVLANCSHVALVRVESVTSTGELAEASTVDVLPLVNQLDGQGNAWPHGVVNGLIYLRVQGGKNAIIMDPEVGDIGIAVFADRDISSVVATKDQANPGSARRFDMADGIYLGGVLNGVPEQFVRFSADGIEIVSPVQVKLSAPNVRIEADTVEVEAGDSITMSAGSSMEATAPNMDFNASTKIRLNTPLVEMTGAASVALLASLNGGFAALPQVGGGASTIQGNLTQTGNFTNNGSVVNNGKDIGANHKHSGVQTGAGQTGGVV